MYIACFGISLTPIECPPRPLGTRHSGLETETINVIHDSLRIQLQCSLLYFPWDRHQTGRAFFSGSSKRRWQCNVNKIAKLSKWWPVNWSHHPVVPTTDSPVLYRATSGHHKTHIIHTELNSVTKITTSSSTVYVNVQITHTPGIKYSH